MVEDDTMSRPIEKNDDLHDDASAAVDASSCKSSFFSIGRDIVSSSTIAFLFVSSPRADRRLAILRCSAASSATRRPLRDAACSTGAATSVDGALWTTAADGSGMAAGLAAAGVVNSVSERRAGREPLACRSDLGRFIVDRAGGHPFQDPLPK